MNVKRRIETYSFYDRSGIASHLEAMAAKGWRLASMTNTTWIYHSAQPRRLHYAVTYYPRGSAFDPLPNEELAEFYELCEHEGWEYVAGFTEIQVFVNRRESPVPLETDPVVELYAIEKSARRRLTRPYWILFAFSVLFAFLGLGNLFVDPVYALSGLYSVPAGICCVFCTATLAVELAGYYRWRSRARKAAEHGESVETKSPHTALRVLMACTLTAFALTLLCIFIAGDNYARFSFALVLVVYAIAFALMHTSVDRLKKRGSSKGRTFAVSFALVLVVSVVLYMGAGHFAFGLARADGNKSYVNHSLSLSDLTGADMPGYVRTPSDRESVILAQSSVDESMHYEALGEDIGELEYTTTYVKFASLYGFCERSLSRGGESSDPAPWAAERAYKTGEHSWVLCYSDRLVEITLPFEPTAAQAGIVGARLGA